MSANLNIKNTGECGCATTDASTCSCGGQGCGKCHAKGTYVRPRFFAGQLLTEEDLQLLGDYVVEKNRLHNRSLFGEGVVCGLEVTCPPCGEGHVTVGPGYALDCCGNDLTLACATTLDINAMIRELRLKNLGADCGDPCAEDNKRTVESKDAAGRNARSKEDSKSNYEEAARHYCLYIRYCEEMTDPVAPYSTGEPCGAEVCEPTRISESVRFELRCGEEKEPKVDLFSRIRECFGDLDSIEKSAMDAKYFQVFARKTLYASEQIRISEVPSFSEDHLAELKISVVALDSHLAGQSETELESEKTKKMIEERIGGTRGTGDLPHEVSSVTDDFVQSALAHVLETSSVIARYYSSKATEDLALKEKYAESEPNIERAKVVLSKAGEVINSELINRTLTSPLEKESALALMEMTNEVTKENPNVSAHEYRYLAEKAIVTQQVMTKSANSLEALREWLLDKLDKSPHLTDCELRQAARYLTVETDPFQRPKSQIDRVGLYAGIGNANYIGNTANSLVNVFIRYLRDCICSALNPVCQPCDDPAVLLACVELKECEVVSICNLERTYVLSPTAVRYWFPPIGLLGEAIEKLCCSPIKLPETKTNLSQTRRETLFLNSTSGVPRLFESGRRSAPAQVENVVRSIFPLVEPSLRPDMTRILSQIARPAITPESEIVARPAAFDLSNFVTGRMLDQFTAIVDERVEMRLAMKEETVGKKPVEPKKKAPARKTKKTKKDTEEEGKK